jgi:hypothetical protein
MKGTRLSERDTAFKVSIRDITEGRFSKSKSRWEPSYVLTPLDENVSRVRVMGTVVARFVSEDQKYASLTLDDGSDTIAVKAFRDSVGLLLGVKPGDIVDVVGKVKEYAGEKYINAESAWRVEDPNWELVRRLELLIKRRGAGKKTLPPEKPVEVSREEVEVAEEVVKEEPKILLLNLIEELDEGEGVKYVTLLKESGLSEEAMETTLNELMQDGEVYEPKIGRFKRV